MQGVVGTIFVRKTTPQFISQQCPKELGTIVLQDAGPGEHLTKI